MINSEQIVIAVARGKALRRGLPLLALTVPPMIVCWRVASRLQFQPTPVDNHLDDYAWAVVLTVVLLGCLWPLWRGLAWLLLAAWPGRLGIEAGADGLVFRLGPFGSKTFDWQRLEARYWYEMPETGEEWGYEAYLDEEEQRRRFLPRLKHPDHSQLLNTFFDRFAAGSEHEWADALRPRLAALRVDRQDD